MAGQIIDAFRLQREMAELYIDCDEVRISYIKPDRIEVRFDWYLEDIHCLWHGSFVETEYLKADPLPEILAFARRAYEYEKGRNRGEYE